MSPDEPLTYAAAGVDIDAADQAIKRITPHVKSTFRPEVLSDIGSFGSLFQLGNHYKEPVLVSGTDGVGTKLAVAQRVGKFDTVGIDLVGTCVDDLICQGAETLFFLDYISVGKVDPAKIEELVSGIAEGCRIAGAALVGGEISEHAGVMAADDFDLVGFAVGVVERDAILPQNVGIGDVVIGLPSPNLRSNGFSLVRKVFFDVAQRDVDSPAWHGADHTLGEELLKPSVIYAPAVMEVRREVPLHGIAHITGGGIENNLDRVLPKTCDAIVDTSSWERPEIFNEVQRIGNIAESEMRRTFNLGIGMAVVVAEQDAHKAIDQFRLHGHRAVQIGEIVSGTGTVQFN